MQWMEMSAYLKEASNGVNRVWSDLKNGLIKNNGF